MIPTAVARDNGRRVFRVQWTPGTDRLLALCHCGAQQPAEDPVQAWEWLLAHPVGHGDGGDPSDNRERM